MRGVRVWGGYIQTHRKSDPKQVTGTFPFLLSDVVRTAFFHFREKLRNLVMHEHDAACSYNHHIGKSVLCYCHFLVFCVVTEHFLTFSNSCNIRDLHKNDALGSGVAFSGIAFAV